MKVTLRDGHHLHVRIHGDGGPDVLLLHGWVVSGEVWQPVIDRWPAHGAGRLLAIDLRGTGWSSKPQTGYTPEDHAADISRLIDALGLRGIVLVGHSLGGLIAQRVALDRPEVVARLVLVCPVPATGVPMDDSQIAFIHAQCGHPDGARQLITMLSSEQVDRDAVERLVLSASATCDGAFHESFDAWRRPSFAAELSRMTAPTVVIAADSDKAFPLAFLRQSVVERIPGASLIEIPKCGHYPQIEAPDLLTQRLREQAAAAV